MDSLRRDFTTLADQRHQYGMTYFGERNSAVEQELGNYDEQPDDDDYSFEYIQRELAKLGIESVSAFVFLSMIMI